MCAATSGGRCPASRAGPLPTGEIPRHRRSRSRSQRRSQRLQLLHSQGLAAPAPILLVPPLVRMKLPLRAAGLINVHGVDTCAALLLLHGPEEQQAHRVEVGTGWSTGGLQASGSWDSRRAGAPPLQARPRHSRAALRAYHGPFCCPKRPSKTAWRELVAAQLHEGDPDWPHAPWPSRVLHN